VSNLDFDFRKLLEIEACTNCRICAEVCPAVEAAADGKLSGVYRLKELKKILRARTTLWRRLLGRKEPPASQWKDFSQTVFRCTLCGNCQEVCPVGIHLKDLWLRVRLDLNHASYYPEKIDMIRKNIAESHNVFAEDNEERAEWVEDCEDSTEEGFCKETAEVVYFTGCVAAFFPVAQQIPVALAKIFQAAEVDFTLLGQNEWCCGFPLVGAGLPDQAQESIAHNLEAVAEKRASNVVFSCPSCYRMWQESYPYPDHVEIFHSTGFLLRLIREKRLKFRGPPLRVTYHDPCDLGRGAREFEAARSVIRAIPGVELVELERNRENCRCCGGGGNLEMIDAELSGRITERKIREIQATGAQAVVTSCQQCVRTMTTWVRRNELPLEVLDITRLVARALDA
jgi:heterodisulfide reductase subunit D